MPRRVRPRKLDLYNKKCFNKIIKGIKVLGKAKRALEKIEDEICSIAKDNNMVGKKEE